MIFSVRMPEIRLHTIAAPARSKKRERRVGRGGKRGTYSGRGIKGQKARSGARGGLVQLGFRRTMKSTPKLPGFQSIHRKVPAVTLAQLEMLFEAGDAVTSQALRMKGVLAQADRIYKVIGTGVLTKPLMVKARACSMGAERAIHAAGGTVIRISK